MATHNDNNNNICISPDCERLSKEKYSKIMIQNYVIYQIDLNEIRNMIKTIIYIHSHIILYKKMLILT